MICPICGAEGGDSGICQNCGTVLTGADWQELTDERIRRAGEAIERMEREGVMAPPPSAPEAGSATEETPAPPVAPAQTAGSAPAPTPEPAQATAPAQAAAPVPASADAGSPAGVPAPSGSPQKASGAAFAIVILGLVLSVLFFTCVPGLICSIVGLVLNARNNSRGLDNPRAFATKAVGVVGVVLGVLIVALFAFACITAKNIADEMERHGWTADQVEVVADDNGMIVVREKAKAGGTSASASAVSAGTADSQAGSASSAGASAEAAASSASGASDSAASSRKSFDPACLDGRGNPTIYALLEMDGREIQDLLESSDYVWTDEVSSWLARNGGLFCAIDGDGDSLSRSDVDSLPAGCEGSPVMYMLALEGYASPADAIDGAAANVRVDSTFEAEGSAFAVVHGRSLDPHLVVASETDTGEQTLLVYSEEAVAKGTFANTIGIDAGTTIEEVWKTITAS